MIDIPINISYNELLMAYADLRKGKSRKTSCIEFEGNFFENITDLHSDLLSGLYKTKPSTCFVVTSPNTREIWSAQFRDRIIHHLLYRYLQPIFEPEFSESSCACIPSRGTLYGAVRLEGMVKESLLDFENPFYLKMDLSNFFVSINKNILWEILKEKIPDQWALDLTKYVLYNDPRIGAIYNSDPEMFLKVEERKRLNLCDDIHGLPIGNLTSQFFANVLLNELDQYVERALGIKYYVRYVDDMVILGDSSAYLKDIENKLHEFVKLLDLQFNPKKTIIQPVSRDVTFVGHRITKNGRALSKDCRNRFLSKIKKSYCVDHVDAFLGYLSQYTQCYSITEALVILQLLSGHCKNATRMMLDRYRDSIEERLENGKFMENKYLKGPLNKIFNQLVGDIPQ